MRALLVVDIQNDFLPGGALSVKEGNLIIPVVNRLMAKNFDGVVATKDWHPSDHVSFAENHKDLKVGDHIDLDGFDQILWPRHCVQGTQGAEFAQALDTKFIQKVFYKGTHSRIDSYSTFYDNEHLQSTGLDLYLKERGVDTLYIVGLATDYCVKYSALDALNLGYNVYIVVDACRGVDLQKDDSLQALQELQVKGAHLIYEDMLH